MLFKRVKWGSARAGVIAPEELRRRTVFTATETRKEIAGGVGFSAPPPTAGAAHDRSAAGAPPSTAAQIRSSSVVENARDRSFF